MNCTLIKNCAESYRSLKHDEIVTLEQQGNCSNDWSRVQVSNGTDNEVKQSIAHIKNCSFSGESIFLGTFLHSVQFNTNVMVHSGLYNSNFHNLCIVSNNSYINNVIAVSNVYIGENASLVQCNQIIGSAESVECQPSFGRGVITVGPENNNEGTSRLVRISPEVRYSDVCADVLQCTRASLSTPVPSAPASTHNLTKIGNNSHISNCDLILNTHIAPSTIVRRSQITDSTICGPAEEEGASHVVISGSTVAHSIIHHHCVVENNATLDGVLMFAHSSVSTNAHVVQSVLASDSGVSHAECCHSVLGPFVGFHHTSLLIATAWLLGRGNVGYGAMVGANHTGRSNDQECALGEGCFVGLGSAVKFPFNTLESPYTIIAAASVCLPQKVSFPFSLICTP